MNIDKQIRTIKRIKKQVSDRALKYYKKYKEERDTDALIDYLDESQVISHLSLEENLLLQHKKAITINIIAIFINIFSVGLAILLIFNV